LGESRTSERWLDSLSHFQRWRVSPADRPVGKRKTCPEKTAKKSFMDLGFSNGMVRSRVVDSA
jgi:hypothetical protein